MLCNVHAVNREELEVEMYEAVRSKMVSLPLPVGDMSALSPGGRVCTVRESEVSLMPRCARICKVIVVTSGWTLNEGDKSPEG